MLPPLSEPTFARIAGLMRATIGIALGPNKQALVASRLAPRILRLELDSYEDYLHLIEDEDAGPEFQMAVDLLTTNETYFFREPAHFTLLEREFGHARGRDVKVWSAASSFGDEAYSIAMVLADLAATGKVGAGWSVLGTDISDRVLRVAQEAVYPSDRLRHVPPRRLKSYCLRGEGASEGWSCVKPEITRQVQFGRLNLFEPLDLPGSFDAVFLRNVLIYFDGPTKRQVIERVLHKLRPGGLFFIGMAEGRVDRSLPLDYLSSGAYRRTAG